jgi:hypothetical protein
MAVRRSPAVAFVLRYTRIKLGETANANTNPIAHTV